eukprot:6489828-Prorocentrum_lima.AAC.1
MDDGYGAGTVQEIMSFKKEFGKRVTHKFQGPVAVGGRYSFLGCERELWQDALVLRPADKYIERYLAMLSLTGCKPVWTNYCEADWSAD